MAQRKIKKDIDGLSKRAKKSQLSISDLMIPLVSVVVLIILSVFVFFPMINTANSYRRELTQINEKLEQLDELEQKILDLDESQLYSDLITSKEIIPNVLRVSDFIFHIDDLAREKNLSTREITARDVSVGASETQIQGSLGVSGPLSYTGEYSEILSFLDEIQGYSPYLVTLRNIALTARGEQWSVDFILSGYYIPERDLRADYYAPFTPYTRFADVIEIFKIRTERRND